MADLYSRDQILDLLTATWDYCAGRWSAEPKFNPRHAAEVQLAESELEPVADERTLFVRVARELYEQRAMFEHTPMIVKMTEPDEHGEIHMVFTDQVG
jgi:hypothetical protein